MPEDASSAALHGLVELRAGHALTWEEARQQADDEAGGLPTCDDLREAGVSAGDGIDLWMPVQRADGRKGDYCQIGNHPHNKERYISHIDAYGPTSWHTNTDAAAMMRSLRRSRHALLGMRPEWRRSLTSASPAMC